MEKTVEFYYDVIQYLQLNYMNLGFVLLFVVAGFLTTGFIKRRIKKRISRRSPNPITATFISQIISFALKTIIVFITLYLLGLNSFTNKFLAGAGLLAIVIGFALKDIGENFLAGIILAFKSPFRVNDLIEVNNIEGFVKDINISETHIKTPDGKDVFIPNSIIMINELATNTINIRVMFWVDTFKTTKRSVHHGIRSKVMNDVVAALIGNGFSLPASVIELKNYDPSIPLHLKVETNEDGITKP